MQLPGERLLRMTDSLLLEAPLFAACKQCYFVLKDKR